MSGRVLLGLLAALPLMAGCQRPPPRAQGEFSRAAVPLLVVAASGDERGAETAPPPKATAPRPVEPTPNGYVPMSVAGVFPRQHGAAVLLEDASKQTVVPIVVGGSEAMSIRLRLEHAKYVRPLTHDLLDTITRTLGGEFAKAQVDDVDGELLLGSIFVRKDGKELRTEARPSDAIALALGADAPIFVSKRVVDAAGVPRELILRTDGDRERLELPGEGTDPETAGVSL